MDSEEFREQFAQADMVLVGLGEEFDASSQLNNVQKFVNGKKLLQDRNALWLLPAWGEYCTEKLGMNAVRTALEKLSYLLEGKNHFVVSVSTNSDIVFILGGRKRLVMPCGSVLAKQCASGCEGEPSPVSADDRTSLTDFFEKLWHDSPVQEGSALLGKCGQCGSSMVLNNVYADKYNEKGYLEDWQFYTKWLQGTLNRRLLLLELGVSMGFPSVVRYPFERVAVYNNKAFLCRVNEKTYQVPTDLSNKGCGISKNAIDWLGQL